MLIVAGLECLRRLVEEGIQCSYILINAVSYIMKEVRVIVVDVTCIYGINTTMCTEWRTACVICWCNCLYFKYAITSALYAITSAICV